jgi:hypothetical protein
LVSLDLYFTRLYACLVQAYFIAIHLETFGQSGPNFSIIKGKKTKKTTYNLQNTTQKTKDRATRTVQKRENNNNNKNIITTGDTLIQ